MIDPDAILAAIDKLPPLRPDSERWYIGASEIGDDCARKLWLKFHRYVEPEQFDPEDLDIESPDDAKQESTKARMRRLFQRGHDEELRFEGYLHEIGAKIVQGSLDQAGFVDGFFSGHSDGHMIYVTEEAINEYKTHNKKSFNTLKRGELLRTHPKHFAQAQSYMKYFKKPQCVYLAVCKDDDRLFCDVILYDEEKANEYSAKAEFISMADKPPDRISNKPTFYKCKMCTAKDVCFGFELPRVNCRNCTSSSKEPRHGKFLCEKVMKEGTIEQRSLNNHLPVEGFCESHSFNPYAMNDMYGWSPLEFFPKQRAVKYDNGIINGAAPFGVPSKELKID